MHAEQGPDDRIERAAPVETRPWVSRGFTLIEDVVYIGLSILLAIGAVGLLGHAARAFAVDVAAGPLSVATIGLLDRLLLVLMILELLYTVQISLREHALVPEPFLIVGLVAAVRRILVLTAEFASLQGKGEAMVRVALLELVLLTLMVITFVMSLHLLRRGGAR